jgi:hypothetical protein
MAGAVTATATAALASPGASTEPARATTLRGETLFGGGAPGLEIVDLHAHFFNMFYLPVVGTLTAVGVPDAVAKAIHAILKGIAGDPESARMSSEGAKERADLVAAADEKVDSDEEVEARDAVARIAPADVFRSPDLIRALDRLEPSVVRLLPRGAVRALFPEERRKMAGSYGLADRDDQLMAALRSDREAQRALVRGIMDHLNWQTFKWMYLMTKPETEIMEKLEKVFPAVSLFAHSMMDMDLHYGYEPPHYAVTSPPWAPNADDQVSRTARLVASANGRYVALVAWDPFHGDALEIVKAAIEGKGFKGLKFYPSNGFRPIANDADIVKTMDPAVVNQRNMDLYRYCVEKQVPIFAHCAHGDMQAQKGFDDCANPKWWRKVLEYQAGGKRPFSGLRLCFAHAGGAAEWALPPIMENQFTASWAGQVHALCNDPGFPNVHADFGMFTVVLDAQKREWLGTRLERLFAASDGAGNPMPFANRTCYGSDWSMLYRASDQGRYLDRFLEMFERPGLKAYAERFFGLNAKHFLGI